MGKQSAEVVRLVINATEQCFYDNSKLEKMRRQESVTTERCTVIGFIKPMTFLFSNRRLRQRRRTWGMDWGNPQH